MLCSSPDDATSHEYSSGICRDFTILCRAGTAAAQHERQPARIDEGQLPSRSATGSQHEQQRDQHEQHEQRDNAQRMKEEARQRRQRISGWQHRTRGRGYPARNPGGRIVPVTPALTEPKRFKLPRPNPPRGGDNTEKSKAPIRRRFFSVSK